MTLVEPFPLPLSPHSLTEKLGGGSVLALSLVHLAGLRSALERGEFLPAERLNPAELERYSTYRFEKRRLEWLGGRWAAKDAAARLVAGTGPKDWGVEAGADGRPFYLPLRNSAPRPELSISHSHGLAAAVAMADAHCGLDLQKVTDGVFRIREKFCHATEAAMLRCLGRSPAQMLESLTMLWTAKEALRKGLGGHPLTGFLAMRLKSLDRLGERAWLCTLDLTGNRPGRQLVVTWWLEDFAVALTAISAD